MEPRSISIQPSEHHSYPYSFFLGHGNVKQDLQTFLSTLPDHRIAIIADNTVTELWGEQMEMVLKLIGREAAFLTFSAGEQNKNQKTVTKLQHALLKQRFGRDTLIIALGGGVTGDIAGFIASTFLRGVPYIQVPTTLLAMIDSSVGGKVGIDTPHGKNLIGSFYQPGVVIADLVFLSTLPSEHIKNGLFEAIKLFYVSNSKSLGLLHPLDLERPLENPEVLAEIIWRSVRGKAFVVERDEQEQNERRILNFGHTIGHALELVSNYELLHGFAVAYGILVEAEIAEQLGILSRQSYLTVRDLLASFGIQGAAVKKYPAEEVLLATRGDKKARGGRPHYVLLNSIGSVHVVDGQYAHPVDDEVVKRALDVVSTAS